MLDACIKAKGQGGIKAIIIYPMNALAADQARRIARLVAKDASPRGPPRRPLRRRAPASRAEQVMTPTGGHQLTAIRYVRDPPDILLTNYKMLDYLLVRPENATLWADEHGPRPCAISSWTNCTRSTALRALTSRSLIRRLKFRARHGRGPPVCVGTSATLGGPAAIPDLLNYARRVFDEDFDDDAIVVEDRQTVGEYLDGFDIDYSNTPLPDEVRQLAEGASDISRSR